MLRSRLETVLPLRRRLLWRRVLSVGDVVSGRGHRVVLSRRGPALQRARALLRGRGCVLRRSLLSGRNELLWPDAMLRPDNPTVLRQGGFVLCDRWRLLRR